MAREKLENWVKLADWLKGRGDITPNTAATYMRRHPEDFEGHTRRKNTKTPLFIDTKAQELLSEVYPLRSATIVEGIPQAEYDELKAKYDGLVANITEMSKLVIDAQQQAAEASKMLLEVQQANQLLLTQNQDLTEKQEKLKNRSLIQRIFNKDA